MYTDTLFLFLLRHIKECLDRFLNDTCDNDDAKLREIGTRLDRESHGESMVQWYSYVNDSVNKTLVVRNEIRFFPFFIRNTTPSCCSTGVQQTAR